METLKDKAAAMLQRSEIVILASVNPEGCPRPVPMSKVRSEGYSTVWMATGMSSLKTKDFLHDPKAGLCIYENGNSLVFTGEVDVITDAGTKQEMWQEWFINHFPGGPADPGYVLLRFRGHHVTFWIDGTFIHRAVK